MRARAATRESTIAALAERQPDLGGEILGCQYRPGWTHNASKGRATAGRRPAAEFAEYQPLPREVSAMRVFVSARYARKPSTIATKPSYAAAAEWSIAVSPARRLP